MGNTTQKSISRKRALQAAWAILLNEDVTIYYLVKRHSNRNAPNKIEARDLALFAAH
ncbi:MAG: hypothetical protein HYU71_15680 [Bacteroidetes bacterium]|nr:hypothetical protein [Bacteroidota bacterium]